jgi:hypothetical protein
MIYFLFNNQPSQHILVFLNLDVGLLIFYLFVSEVLFIFVGLGVLGLLFVGVAGGGFLGIVRVSS